MNLLVLLTCALFGAGAVIAQGQGGPPSPPQYSTGGWRPLLNSIFARLPRHAYPPPPRARAHAHEERFQVAATQYQPYYSRNAFSHPFAHYRAAPQYGPQYGRIPSFTPIPDAPRRQQAAPAVYITAAPPTAGTYQPQVRPVITIAHAPVVAYVTAAPPLAADYAPARAPAVEPITARPTYADADDGYTSGGGRETTGSKYESDAQISSQALTPQADGQRYNDFEREILSSIRVGGSPSQSQSQVDIDSQSLEPEPPRAEAPRLTPQNIRLVFHDSADEEKVRSTLREKSRNANEDASFIVAPAQHVLQRQRIMIPAPPQPVVYILLRKPVITSEVKFERQEAEGEAKKPRVFVTYEDVSKVLQKTIDLKTGRVEEQGARTQREKI